MKQFLRVATAVLLVLTAVSVDAFGEDKPAPRLVTVAGEAEVNVAPDEVRYDVTIQSFSKELKQAKAQTDERLKGLIALAKKHGVADSDTQTDYIKLEPRFRGNDDSRAFIGYWVRKDLVFTLRDVSHAEGLLSELIDFGVWRINSISFQTSQLRKYRDQARDLAMKAAQEKASALASAVGQKIGKAYSIDEEVPGQANGSRNYMANNTTTYDSDSASSSEGTLALGLIKISARVTVKFELE
jgi:uncharacterized protein YggE